MRRRADQIGETRQRITLAAVKLHTSVGPASTTISGVAEEAGVTRLTVYRHFEDLDALFEACMGHWSSVNPGPDLDAWRTIEPLEARAGHAFGELYAWYGSRGAELYPIYRDRSAMPETAQAVMDAQADALAAAILGSEAHRIEAEASSVRMAVARHLVDFWTWRSLVVERGLEGEVAATAAVAMLCSVADD